MVSYKNNPNYKKVQIRNKKGVYQTVYKRKFPAKGTKNRGLDQRDRDILRKRVKLLNKRKGPRVGDYLRLPDGKITRITYIWSNSDGSPYSIQAGGGNYGYYLGDGYVSYSGGLDPGFKMSKYTIKRSGTKPGHVWFFHNDWREADNSVNAVVRFRVFSLTRRK